jgi:carbamoyltransferase
MTLFLGMKPNEHEFKVMGLAPYGKAKHAQKAIDVSKSTLYVDGIEFKWREKPTDSEYIGMVVSELATHMTNA